jgi:phosphoribosylformylglycinamidine synthase subunit PurL
MPIVSGNVSLYNESKATGGGSAILPTPAIGAVGVLDDWEKSARIGFRAADEQIILIGKFPAGALGQSIWLREMHGRQDGSPPTVDLEAELNAGKIVRELLADGILTAVHDISDGGLAVAIAEMALASGLGAFVDTYGRSAWELTDIEFLFGEDQGRYLATVASNELAQEVCKRVEALGVSFTYLGSVTNSSAINFGGPQGTSDHVATVSLADLRAAHEGFFPTLMGVDGALA